MLPVEMEKFVKHEENEEEIYNRHLQQSIFELELELLQIYSDQGLPNMKQQDPASEKLENLIKKQEHNIELLLQENKRLKKQVAALTYADNYRHLAGWAGNIGLLPLYPAEQHEQPQLEVREADQEIPAGAAKVASALAEEMFFLQLEEDAAFISTMLETIDSLQLKYSTLPVISGLDRMDQSSNEVYMRDQSTHITLDKLVTITDVQSSLDTNNNLLVQSHLTPGPPAMKQRGSWWPAGTLNPFKSAARLNIAPLMNCRLDVDTNWVKPDTFLASIKPRDPTLTTSPPPSTSTTVGPSSHGRRPRPGGGRTGRVDRKPGRARVRQFQP